MSGTIDRILLDFSFLSVEKFVAEDLDPIPVWILNESYFFHRALAQLFLEFNIFFFQVRASLMHVITGDCDVTEALRRLVAVMIAGEFVVGFGAPIMA